MLSMAGTVQSDCDVGGEGLFQGRVVNLVLERSFLGLVVDRWAETDVPMHFFAELKLYARAETAEASCSATKEDGRSGKGLPGTPIQLSLFQHS